MEQFAKYALERNDLAIATDITRSILHIMAANHTQTKKLKGLRTRIHKLASNLAQYNNAHLDKHECFLSKHHRSLPYMVNKQLAPKKNQPEYVIDMW